MGNASIGQNLHDVLNWAALGRLTVEKTCVGLASIPVQMMDAPTEGKSGLTANIMQSGESVPLLGAYV